MARGLRPEDALRFARGDVVTTENGQQAQLQSAARFLTIADHGAAIGLGEALINGNPEYMVDPTLKRWHDMLKSGPEEAAKPTFELIASYSQGTLPPNLNDPKIAGPIIIRHGVIMSRTVERYNDPGKFSAFIGYEFTSLPKGNNLHRVVMFRDDAKRFGATLPFTANQSQDPEDLWTWMAGYEARTGGGCAGDGRIMAISPMV